MKAHPVESRPMAVQRQFTAEWEVRADDGGPYKYSGEQCTYCGSVRPEDLEKLLAAEGVDIHLADMKYGWPHKFYIEAPNECAGEDREYGSRSERGADGNIVRTPMRGPAGKTQQLKFYTEHMHDLGDEDFTRIAAVIRDKTGIDLQREPGDKIKWRRTARKT